MMAVSTQVAKILSKVSIFKEIGPAELEELALTCLKKRFPPNTKITLEEGKEHSFCIIREGTIIAKDLESGNAIKTMGQSDFFGEISVFDGKDYPVEFYSGNKEAEILIFSKKDFVDLLQNHPLTHFALSRELCIRLRATKNNKCFTSVSTKVRVGSALLKLAKSESAIKTPSGIILPKISQDELCESADVSKQCLQDIFLELKENNVILPENKQILLPDTITLENWVKKFLA